MKNISLLSIAFIVTMFFISSCDEEQNQVRQNSDQIQVDLQQDSEQQELQSDGVNTFSTREIDSLKFTYQAEPSNGLYFVPKASRIAIDLLPLKMWEKLTSRDIAWGHPDEVNYTWHLYHRVDWMKITTGGKPMTVAPVDSGYVLTIPLDGTSSNRLKSLLEKRSEGLYTILIDGKGTSFHPRGEGLRNDAITIFHRDRTPLEALKKALNS